MTASTSSNRAMPAKPKQCFVVSAFGKTPEDAKRTKQVLRHLVKRVLEPMGYEVRRADEIDDEGLITNQIIERLLDDELVVVDLTGQNPNVFYELAVRHAARKPVVHLITEGEPIPFDVANMRAIPYALDDPDVLEEARLICVARFSRSRRAAAPGPNPVSAARDVWLLRESDQPEVRDIGEILATVNDMKDEVRSLARRMVAERAPDQSLVGPLPSRADLSQAIVGRLAERHMSLSPSDTAVLEHLFVGGPLSAGDLERLAEYSRSTVLRCLRKLSAAGLVESIGIRGLYRADPALFEHVR